MLQHLISVYPNATTTTGEVVTLGAFLRSQRHRDRVEDIRATPDKETRTLLKKSLPAATISGTFSERKISGVLTYNGLICLDFDQADNSHYTAPEMKKILSEIPEIAWASLSVGGNGVFAIVQTNNTDPNRHGELVDFFGTLFIDLNMLIDRSCRDVSRLRFVSYDAEPWYNPNAVVFDATGFFHWKEVEKQKELEARRNRPATTKEGTEYRVKTLVEKIEKGRVDIVDNYHDFLKIGFALASEFGASGEDYFVRICAISNRKSRQPDQTPRKFQELIQNGSGRVTIASLFQIAANHGVKIREEWQNH